MKYPIIRPVVDQYIDELQPMIREILESNMLTNVNNYTKKFEDEVSKYIGVKHCIAVSSGTSGLILTLEALGINKSEIILPSFTFVATPASIYWTKNCIRYSDIDDTFTIDPEDIKKRITPDTKAIIGVHMYGNPCHIDIIDEIAEENDLNVIFDAAHAFGSKYNNVNIGNFGDAEIISLSPTKLITTVEGGCVLTNNDEIAEKVSLLRNYGMRADYTSDHPGLNARMSEINSAVGLVQMKDIDKYVKNRNRYVNYYKEHLKDTNGVYYQRIDKNNLSAHKDFSIIINEEQYGSNRDELGTKLGRNGIGTKRYFFPPMHRIKAYHQDICLPYTEKISNNLLSLPIYNNMELEEIEFICSYIS